MRSIWRLFCIGTSRMSFPLREGARCKEADSRTTMPDAGREKIARGRHLSDEQPGLHLQRPPPQLREGTRLKTPSPAATAAISVARGWVSHPDGGIRA